MSAIFGIICQNKTIKQSDIDSIKLALLPLAADGAGMYVSDTIMIGHHNLIINSSQKNEQLPEETDRFVITSDARIDNRAELIKLLDIKQDPLTIWDSTIILESFKKWGNQCTDYLIGEFAFVIWDKLAHKLFAGTDHIGFRSFYYYHGRGMFIFSSEIKGILACKPSPPSFNLDILAEYFTQNYSGATFDREVFALKGASQLVLDEQFNLIRNIYWTLQPRGKYNFKKDEDWANCLNDLLTNSVRNRLNTDFPVGIALSGGLDSSYLGAITATILNKKNKPLYAFSSVLPEGYAGVEQDERYFINLMGQQFKNIDQSFVYPDMDSGPFTDLEDTFEKAEVLGYNFLFVDKALYAAAKTKNVKVYLTGFGGDFTISNNGDAMVYEMLMEGAFYKAFRYFIKMKNSRGLSLFRAARAMVLGYSPLADMYKPLFGKQKKSGVYPVTRELRRLIASKHNFGTNRPGKQALQTMIGNGIIGGLLYNTNKKLGASYYLDVNVPILDKEINEFFFDVPPEQFILNGQRRSLMRRAMRDLVPDEIRKREDKSAFIPDFARRAIQQRNFIQNILVAEKFERSRKYINKEALLNSLEQFGSLLENNSNAGSRESILTAKSVVFLNWLEENFFFKI